MRAYVMHYRFFLLLVAATDAVADGSAPIRFEFVTEATGDRLRPRQTGSVAIAGRLSRVDYREGGIDRTAVLSENGGETEVALNESRKTYFAPKKRLAEQIDSRLFAMPVAGATESRVTVKELRLSDPPPLVAGADRGYQLLLAYTSDIKVEGSPLQVSYEAKVELWTTSRFAVPYIPDDPRMICTGNAQVDDAVREVLAAVEAFPVRRRVTVTRTLAGGAPFLDVVTTTYQNVRTAELEPSAFHVPSGYAYESPYGVFHEFQTQDIPRRKRAEVIMSFVVRRVQAMAAEEAETTGLETGTLGMGRVAAAAVPGVPSVAAESHTREPVVFRTALACHGHDRKLHDDVGAGFHFERTATKDTWSLLAMTADLRRLV